MTSAWKAPDLYGKVALVAGATRGTGRGIARALGEARATVYCSGRTTASSMSPMGRPETIEETAAMVDEAGGRGIAVRTDHLVVGEVRALVDRIEGNEGRLDLVVNDIWGGDPHIRWGVPFWEADPGVDWRTLENALRTHWNTAALAAPLLNASGGLLVEVTDGDSMQYRGHVIYDLIKTSVIRLAFGFDRDFQGAGAGARATCVTPGFLRSEAMLDHFGVTAETWREQAERDPHFVHSETPLYVGRGVAHLAAEQARDWFAGRVWASWILARRYGFTDSDGSRPDWGAHAEAFFGEDNMRPMDDALMAYFEPLPFDLPDTEP